MPIALSATVGVRVEGSYSNQVGLAAVNGVIARALGVTLSSGTGANQADRIFTETNTLGVSATKDYDLAGVLLDQFGSTLTFVKMKGIFIFADAANTNNVVLGAAAATQFVGPFGANTHTVHARPGGCIALFSPDLTSWAVGAGTTDFLRVANSAGGTSVTYDIVLIGTSA